MALRIIHFGIFNGAIIISAEFFDSNLPMVELSKESVDLIIEGPDLVLRSGSVLNFLNFVNDVGGDLFPPFFALIKIIDFSDVPETTWTFLLLFIDEGPLHRPPSVEHSLSFFAISGHLK